MKLTLLQWSSLIFFGLLGLVCLLLAIKLFIVEYPITKEDQFRRSLKIGGLSGILYCIVVIITGIIIWSETGVFKSMVLALPILCLLPLIVILIVGGSYVQFWWYARLSKYKDEIIRKQVEKYQTQDHSKDT
jgi:cytochrome bd-type quinol oxidase subunit 2